MDASPALCRELNSQVITVAIDSGVELALRRWGSGSPELCLVHGFGDGSFVWESVARALCPARSAVALDLRGHGDSSWDPLQRYGPAQYASDLVSVLDHLDCASIVLVGHSLGADVAIRAAARCSQRVHGLVIVDCGTEVQPAGAALFARQFCSRPTWYESVDAYASQLVEQLPLAERALLEEFARNSLRPSPAVGYSLKYDPALTNHLPQMDSAILRSLLQRIVCPVLLVRGATSAILSQQHAARLARSLPNCAFSSVRAAGHAVMLDNPMGLADILQRFLARLAPSPSALA